MASNTKTITIPREEYRELKKIRSRFEQVLSLLDDFETEDVRLYKPSFLQKLKRAQRDLAAGKYRVRSRY
ncbi:hypothetical protein A3C18_01050 [Candidatus Kaiserbacteria bacterium RIFCSPHIGHO2_02_FULL_54_11b]|uniref:Uncharacterized protein n=2 Tax=Candidatus Kaiseribacteriota TaxID=1752734 RepID=A0A1F6CKI2_9BACT|nr:MAG: hypothetical protein A2704_06995 [Candidatus Kaiserbacteria bacterium RIFCSPHIGHO2_01_FULL_54_36b]OGG63882.1 MAG: hypothetical protein A3C18_01050 [Candidatus Kaiserbacteria bacterium RIFCSPHIGHO2_02_FULL_54_11b]